MSKNPARHRPWRQRLFAVLTRLQLAWLTLALSRPMSCSAEPTLIVAPHQDDEVLGCGGLIALKRRAGAVVRVVFVTDGAAAYGPLPETQKALLQRRRRREALDAVRELGLSEADVTFLDAPDGSLRLVEGAARSELQQALIEQVRAIRAREVFVTHRHDWSEDHRACYELARDALAQIDDDVELWQYAVWLLWSALIVRDFGAGEFSHAKRLAIRQVLSIKRRALRAHRSQCESRGLDQPAVLESGFQSRFCADHEVFFGPERVSRRPHA